MEANKMKAIICKKYGPPDVLELGVVDKPVPNDNEVLLKIHAAGVTISDCYVRSGKVGFWLWLPMRIYVGFKKPRKPILGFDLAGEVEATGKNIQRFKNGDQIFGFSGKSFGAYAEYVCLPEDKMYMPADCIIALKPFNLAYEEASTVPSRGCLALHFMKKGNIQKGQKVLIYGASGGIGTFALQFAKYFGAQVTGVCSTANLEMVKSLGADKVFDYKKEDFSKSGVHYDFIFDATLYNKLNRKKIKLKSLKLLTRNGKYMSIDDETPKLGVENLVFLKELIEIGKIKPVIDRIYSLEQTAEAHRYVEKGHKKGGVVIKINQ